MALSLIHGIFPKYFKWDKDLKSLSLMNRQMMEIHTLFIAIMIFFIGLLCFSYPRELIENPFGKTISMGLAIFWSVRLCVQFFGYSPALWKGKPFETAVHIFFSGFWVYLSAVFWVNSFYQF